MQPGTGNILFYTSDGSFLNELIAFWTHSPYVHVAIQTSASELVEAAKEGVRTAPLDYPATRYAYQARCTHYDEQDLTQALAWLQSKVGTTYGYADFLSNANPFKRWLYLVRAKRYDCSALATEFLIQAGGVNLQGLEEDPHSVTPGDLAKALRPV